MKTIEELVDSVIDHGDFNVCDMFYEGAEYALEDAGGKMPKGLELKEVQSIGGCEGELRDHAEFTLEVIQDGTSVGYVTFDGWYASHDGVYFEDGYYVSELVEKVVIEYKKVITTSPKSVAPAKGK